MEPTTADIVVAAIALVRDGRVLTVRKRGTERFMLVGGKLEVGESALEAALRETYEEVGLEIGSATLLGEFFSEAANEPGHTLHSTVFWAESDAEPVASAEIAEVRWTPLRAAGDPGNAVWRRGQTGSVNETGLPVARAWAISLLVDSPM
jgi:8-oxo-dGTP diphosphatase